MHMRADESLAVETVRAIRTGNVAALKRLLEENPGLSRAKIGQAESSAAKGADQRFRTLLHIVTDWPGNFPNGAETIRTLIAFGADPNERFVGPHSETPLHWAASCDDVAALDALLDAGSDIEADGAVIGGGTPLADAVAFGQWRAAQRLIERGAKANLWQAAALGLMDRVQALVEGPSAPPPREVTQAFWCACHGGSLEAAQFLYERAADIDWIGYDGLTPLDAARRRKAQDVIDWLSGLGAKSTDESNASDGSGEAP